MTPEDIVAAVAVIAAEEGALAERAARIASAIRDFGGYRWVGVYGVTEADVVILGYAGPGAPAFPRFPRTKGLTAAAIAAGQTVVVDDVTSDPRYLTAFDSTRSEMVVPVVGSDGTTVIGTIDVESDRVAAFGTEERRFVERLARAALPLYATP